MCSRCFLRICISIPFSLACARMAGSVSEHAPVPLCRVLVSLAPARWMNCASAFPRFFSPAFYAATASLSFSRPSNVTPFSPTFHDVHCTFCLLSSWLSKDKKRKEDCSSYLIIYSRQSLLGPRSVKTYLNKEYFTLNRMWVCVVLFHSPRIGIYPHLHTFNITGAADRILRDCPIQIPLQIQDENLHQGGSRWFFSTVAVSTRQPRDPPTWHWLTRKHQRYFICKSLEFPFTLSTIRTIDLEAFREKVN